ncbi:MAG: sigma-70 family RNA polymerase sigma factor [Planctomycetota bacterium]|nr:sigma-70 family RNA polymerase sigma factor [Planctomycetota bacterium]
MASSAKSETAVILADLAGGDKGAVDRLLPLVYDELRALAEHHFRRQRPGQTLQPTALVHEAYLRLVRQPAGSFKDRAHFMAVAAKAMRQLLIDRARRARAAKRGGSAQRVTLDEEAVPGDDRDVDVLSLEEALQRLAAMDDRKSRIVELRFFGGLTIEEAAEVLGIARSTVTEDWRLARAWLICELRGE